LAQELLAWLPLEGYRLLVAKFVLSMQAMKSAVEFALIKWMDFS
jgi:hypothetical protein